MQVLVSKDGWNVSFFSSDVDARPLYLESSFFLLNFFLKKSREQALSRGNEGAIEGFCDNNPLEAASAAVEAGRVHSRPMSELEVRDRFMALPTRPSAALYAPMKLFV